jgi:23S rRNA pseudouridine955/2504/2580 synthase
MPLAKYSNPAGERRVRVQADGQASHTVFELRRRIGEFTLLDAELKTGRTHQIRVHLASSGYPIAGDDKYGDFTINRALQKADGARPPLKRMFLHAYRAGFRHPDSGERVVLDAPLPKDCMDFLRGLEAGGLQVKPRIKDGD